jgi:hypothetical protein
MIMAVTVANILGGPMDVFRAAVGNPEPDESDNLASYDPLTDGWIDCGGSNGGLNITIAQEFGTVEADQTVDIIASLASSRKIDLELTLLETTLTNMRLANNGGTITTGANTDKYEPITNTVATPPDYGAYLLRGVSGINSKRSIVILRRALVASDVSWSHKKDEATMLGITATSHYVSSTVGPFVMLQSK